MIKPAGALCNLACDYCFFSHKTELLNSNKVMPAPVLETFIRDYIASQPDEVVVFTWQGGEPTLAGLDFYRQVVELQKRYCPPGKYIENDLQTNGTLLDAEWFTFLKENRFLVGLSVDGPPELHDLHRRYRNGAPGSTKIRECAPELKARGIPFNTLTAVNRDNAKHPLEVYRYLRDQLGAEHIQFLPVVETCEFETVAPGFWDWNALKSGQEIVTPWSVEPMEYGKFLTEIFKEWFRYDYGKRFIYLFEALLGIWAGYRSPICTLAPSCGGALALDSDGTLYCCDRFCYPAYKLGNIMETPLTELAARNANKIFSRFKAGLPKQCRECEYLFACHGECPKNRFRLTPDGDPALNYLCEGWRYFLGEIKPTMDQLAAQLKAAPRTP